MQLIDHIGSIARKAGQFTQELQMKRGLLVEEKGSAYDFVTEADIGSQQMIRDSIARYFPDDSMIGEEDGISDAEIVRMIRNNSKDHRIWVVDPLDGTVNYIRGIVGYGISIGVFQGNEAVAGAIYQPDTDTLYLAELGSGATKNGKAIRVSAFDRLSQCIGATHIPVSDMNRRAHTNLWNDAACMQCQNLRMMGASTHEQVLVASGGLDFYYEMGPHPWDLAAGCLMITEAGGKVSRLDGGAYDYGLGGIIVSNGAIHSDIVNMIANADPKLSELL